MSTTNNNDVFDIIMLMFKDIHIDSISDIINFVPKLMETVEKIVKLPGKDKKTIVIRIILTLIHKPELIPIAEVMLPILIDTIIEISKGLYKLQSRICPKKCKPLCSCFGK